MTVSQRVLSRICLYWLPRYLLHLRLNAMESNEAPEVDKTRTYLHDLIFRVQDMDPEAARKSVSTLGFQLLSDSQTVDKLCPSNTVTRKLSNRQTIRSELKTSTNDMAASSFSDFFPSSVNDDLDMDSALSRMTNVAPAKREMASIAIPGCDIKVERRKSKRPTMLQLSHQVSTGIGLHFVPKICLVSCVERGYAGIAH